MGRLDLLEALLARHHDLFCELYGDLLRPPLGGMADGLRAM